MESEATPAAPRILRLRRELGWPQHRMADFLRISQAAVSYMEWGQKESGPISIVLDLLEAALSQGGVRPGMSPADCLSALKLPLSEAESADAST